MALAVSLAFLIAGGATAAVAGPTAFDGEDNAPNDVSETATLFYKYQPLMVSFRNSSAALVRACHPSIPWDCASTWRNC